MRFDAHVGQHSAKNNLVDLPLAQLQNKVVGLCAPHLVRRDDDSFAILNVCGVAAVELHRVSFGLTRASGLTDLDIVPWRSTNNEKKFWSAKGLLPSSHGRAGMI